MKTFTKRQQVRWDKKVQERALRKLNEELQDLYVAKRNLGQIELEAPVFIGYERVFMLRADIARRQDAKLFEAILKIINTKVFCKKKTFLSKEWRTGRWKPMAQSTKRLTERDYEKLPESLKKWFRLFYSYKHKKWLYEFTEEYMFTYKISKAYRTHAQILDTDLETRMAEVYHYIERNHLWGKIDKIYGNRHYRGWKGDRIRVREKALKQDFVSQYRAVKDTALYQLSLYKMAG